MSWLSRLFGGDVGDPVTLDHVPVTGALDWRTEKLAEAARRHGKAFKCAGDGVPREVQRDGQFMPVGGNVTRLHARKKS